MRTNPSSSQIDLPSGLAQVRVEACVDRALEELSKSLDLKGRVHIGVMPELNCDGAALCRAMGLVLGQGLLDPEVNVHIDWESVRGEQAVVIRGPLQKAGILPEVDGLLAPSGGRAWLEHRLGDAFPRLYLCPGCLWALASAG